MLLTSNFNPVSEFTNFLSNPYVKLPLGLDINKGVVYIWLTGFVTIVGALLVTRGLKLRPARPQATAEILYDVAQNTIARANLPQEGMRIWFPYVATLFVFIGVMNLIGFIPLPFSSDHVHIGGVAVPQLQIYAASASLSVSLALTLVTFFASHIEGIRYNGVIKYFKSWVPSGSPKPLLVLLIPVEVISQFARLISLSVRLFANMLAGHLVIAVFLALAGLLTTGIGYWFIQPFGLAMGVAIYTLEVVLIAGLQAFIFAILSAIYIGGAIHPDH